MGQNEKRIKELVLNRVASCTQCGGDYGVSDVNVLGHKDDLWFLMLTCGHCHQAVGVAAVVKEEVASSSTDSAERAMVENRTPSGDALAAEALPAEPVNAEDVVAVRDFLNHFDGDFKRLFEGN